MPTSWPGASRAQPRVRRRFGIDIMTETFVADPVAVAALPVQRQGRPNRCAHCGRPFGLVRHRLANRQLCSSPCLTAESQRVQRALREKVSRFVQLPGGC